MKISTTLKKVFGIIELRNLSVQGDFDNLSKVSYHQNSLENHENGYEINGQRNLPLFILH